MGAYLEILDIFGAAKLGQACSTHEGEEMEEEQPMAPQDGVGAFTVAAEPAGEDGTAGKVLGSHHHSGVKASVCPFP